MSLLCGCILNSFIILSDVSSQFESFVEVLEKTDSFYF